MHVLRLKGNNSGNARTSLAFEKRLEHYSCLTRVLIVLILHYLKLEIKAPLFSILSCISSSVVWQLYTKF